MPRSDHLKAGFALAIQVDVSDDTLTVELANGRTVAAPVGWYPRLAHATPEERKYLATHSRWPGNPLAGHRRGH